MYRSGGTRKGERMTKCDLFGRVGDTGLTEDYKDCSTQHFLTGWIRALIPQALTVFGCFEK